MIPQHESLETLKEIRSLMERSSRFLSISGLSGIIAGLAALSGTAAAYFYLGLGPADPGYHQRILREGGGLNREVITFLISDLTLVLMVSLIGASLMTIRRARLDGQSVWDASAKRLLLNLAIPLSTGALFCLVLLYHLNIAFIAPATLIFYGLSLVNASKYTQDHIRYLGLVEILVGLVAALFLDYGLLFWAFGFGIIHIAYGTITYLKYGK